MKSEADTDTLIILDEHRKSPDRTDLDPDHFAQVASGVWVMAQEYNFWGAVGIHDALNYFIGAGQAQYQVQNALKFIEEWRGTPEFTGFLTAAMRLQVHADRMRAHQEARAKREAARAFKIRAVTRENSQELEPVPPPNTTRSQRKSPSRVRLVIAETPKVSKPHASKAR